jgi:HEAT repeat protein
MGPQRLPTPPTPEEVIRLLTVAIRSLSLYTQEHPAFLRTLDQFMTCLDDVFRHKESFSVQVVRDQVLVDQRMLPSSPALRSLAADLLQRGIQGITISRAVSLVEIRLLLEILTRRAAEVGGAPPYEEELRSRNVVRLRIHPLRASLLDSGGTLGETLLEKLLAETGEGRDRRDGLADFLLREPRAVGETIAKLAAREGESGEERARWASERLLVMMEQLLAGHGAEWDRFRDRLAQVVLSLEVQSQLEFFRGAFLRPGDAPRWAQDLAHAMPPSALAELISRELSADRATEEKISFLDALLPRKGEIRDLPPEVKQKLAEYGVSTEEFLRLLGDETVPLSERVNLFLRDQGPDPEAADRAPGLVQELIAAERREDALRVINRFFNGLNHPEWEVRRAVAGKAGAMFQVVSDMGAGAETLGKVRDFAFRKMSAEPDREVFRLLYEALENMALAHLARKEVALAVELLQRVHSCPGLTVLEPGYLARRREMVRRNLAGESLLNEAFEAALSGTESEAQRSLPLIRLMGEEGARRLVELLGTERQVSGRVRLMRLLKELGETAVEPLKRSLLDPRWYLVRNVVSVLGEIGDPGVAPAFLGLLSHPDPRVRKEVVQALGNIATSRAQEGVVQALEDDDESVRLKAVEVIQGLGASGAREKLRLVVSRSGGSRDAAVRTKALRALGNLAQEEDVGVFEILLARKGLFSKMESDDIRRTAVSSLAGILERTRSPKALQLLQNVSRSDPLAEIRKLAEAAVAAFQQSGSPPGS